MIPEALLYDASLTPSAVRVYGALRRHGNDPDDCYPSHARLARLLGMAERSMARPISELADAGWITKVKRPPRQDGSRQTDGYEVHTSPRSGARSTAQTSAALPRDPARDDRAQERGKREPGEREPENERDTPAPSAPALALVAEQQPAVDPFVAFWAAYPNKQAKPTAERAYRKALGVAPAETIAEGLDRWCRYWTARNQPDYVPHPSTWLNRHGWQDPTPALPVQRGVRAPVASDRDAPTGRVTDL